MNQIVTRASIAEIARHRDDCLQAFMEARRMEQAVAEQLKEAALKLKLAAPMAQGLHIASDRQKALTDRQYIDATVWDSLVRSTELNHLMDKKAKDELRQQLITDPPEFTEDTAYATIEQFMAESGMIFRRGIAEAFSNLDRRFRSHSDWKIGNRVILSRAFDDYGHWNYGRDHRATLQDIERTFLILDGRKPVADYAGVVGEIDVARGRGMHARRSEVESEFYKVRIFENGNIHLWFKRDDLVQTANRMIGEYYGEVIPEERSYEDDGGLHEPKRSIAKNYGFFPTPDTLADRTIEDARLYRNEGSFTVLEPSAGSGQLSRRATKYRAIVDCVEFQPDLAQALKTCGHHNNVWCCDFLDLKPSTTGLYDRVIMNPPFDRERDIDHVMHALKFLKSDGFLIAIMSAHTEFAESKKAQAFRALISKMKGKFFDNPRNSFTSVGTNVNTITLQVWKDGHEVWG
jgi:predicted RNA methylase